MSLGIVKAICVSCGTQTERLAVVMDPFVDQSYGVCEECLGPIHAGMWETLRTQLDLANVSATGRSQDET